MKNLWFFPAATFVLGLSTHAYYSERLISILFLIGFIWLFRKTLFLKNIKNLFVFGIALFILTQIPHLLIANSGAFTRRVAQVDYFSEQFFQNNSGGLRYMPLGRPLFISKEFLSHYVAYFSPRNLFFDPDPQPERSIPNLSVFYNWMIIPFLLGFAEFTRKRSTALGKLVFLAMLIGPIPAALTRDPFYTLRALVFLWTLSLIIAFGVNDILNKISNRLIKISLIVVFVLYSGFALYSSYFILLKYEREVFDYSYVKVLEKIKEFPNQKFVVDSSRQLAAGVRFAFFKRYNPYKLQQVLGSKIGDQYYNNVDLDESYILDNIEARPIIWREDVCKKQILVGDLLAISDTQAREHKLQLLFDIKDMAGNLSLKTYLTNPDPKCSIKSVKSMSLLGE